MAQGQLLCEPVRIDISNYQGITEIDHEGVYG
jgi:hypothetical protein